MRRYRWFTAIVICCSVVAFEARAGAPEVGQTIRASVGHEGQQAEPNQRNSYWSNFGSIDSDVSDDGRYIAFSSIADNLVPGDDNGHWDVFLRDVDAGTTTLISAAPDGTSGNEDSRWPSISADGKRLVFTSRASDLVGGDIDGENDIYLKDLVSGLLTRVSVKADGNEDPNETNGGTISGDGRFSAFWASPSFLGHGRREFPVQIVVRDLSTGAMEFASLNDASQLGDQGSWEPQLSYDGRFVAFTSWARNLGPVPPWPGCSSCHSAVYVRDRAEGETHAASFTPVGSVFTEDSYDPVISDDGRFVAFTGVEIEPYANVLGSVSVYVRDLVDAMTTNESRDLAQSAYDDSYLPSISSDGRYLAFTSRVTVRPGDLNPAWADVYLKDRQTGTITTVSVDSASRQAPLTHSNPALSRDGRWIVWESISPTLVDDDSNLMDDIFLRRLF